MLVFLGGPAFAQEDLVNERPPVTRAELERLWGVDCPVAVAGIRRALDAAPAGAVPGPAVERLRALESRLERCAILDRRDGRDAPRHAMLLQRMELWRKAMTAGETCRARAQRRAVREVLDTYFDLGQGS